MPYSKKHNKVLIRLILSLIALYFLIDIFGGYALESIVKTRLHSYVNDKPDRLYDISYRTINISIADRAIRLGKIKIAPRQNAIDSIRKNKISTLTYFEADTFYFDGLSFVKLILFNELKLQNIVSNNPVVKIYFNPKAKSPAKKSGVTGNVVSDKMHYGYIDHFKIKNGNFYIYKIPSKDSLYFKLNSSTLNIEKIEISPKAKKQIEIVKFKTFHFSSGHLYGGFVDNYRISADSITLDHDTRTLCIDNFSFKPLNFKITNKKVQFAHDVSSAEVIKITVRNINFKGNGKFYGYYASNIIIDKLDFALSTDKRLPKNMNRKPLIGELIKKVSIPFCVDTVKIKESSIFYNEIVSADKEPLKVLFTKVDLDILNATNSDEMIKENPDLKITGKAKFLNTGDLDIDIKVPLNDKEDKMIVSGHLGPMSVKPVNKMLEGPLNVRFVSGRINSIDMNFVADTKHSTGKFQFDYNDLVIQIFKGKEATKKGVKERNKWFVNVIANGVIKKNNNRKSDKFVTGIIDYDRTKDIAIPGYLFRSIKSGLISTFKPGTRRKAVKEENKEKREVKKENKDEIKSKKKESKKDKKGIFKKKEKE